MTKPRSRSIWPLLCRYTAGAAYVHDSPGLGDELGFIPTNNATLQSTVAPNVFVLGDAADVPASKAGSVTHFEGEILLENVEAFLEGNELPATFDGHANCFIETGFLQGSADRLQLPDRATCRALPRPDRTAAAEGIPP